MPPPPPLSPAACTRVNGEGLVDTYLSVPAPTCTLFHHLPPGRCPSSACMG